VKPFIFTTQTHTNTHTHTHTGTRLWNTLVEAVNAREKAEEKQGHFEETIKSLRKTLRCYRFRVNSMLALKANNHFGVKCHGWAGEKIYKDDDKKNECFRKYDSAEESFEDHSDFLLSHQRYSSLFSLSITDYKGWARGLINAGYATNPKYSELLIGLIEELGLNEYDTYKGIGIDADALTQDIDSERIRTNEHVVCINDNRVRFVIAKKGDTFYQIAEEFDLTLRQLNRYNSFPEYKDCLSEGDLVYVMPKRKAKIFKKEVISMEEPMYVNEISQKYGVAEKTLKRLNDFAKDSLVSKGEIITLR